MARQKKTHVPVSFKIDKAIHNKLEQYCQDSGQSKTVAVERALDSYISTYYSEKKKLEALSNKE